MTDTELEERLTALLHRRASEITTAPPIRLAPAGRGRRRQRVAALAVAAAIVTVVLAAGGTVVGIRSAHDRTRPGGATPVAPSPHPSATATSCAVGMPASWQRAIVAGTIQLDHPYNEVISVRPGTGEYLVRQLSSQPTPSGLSGRVTLALFDGKTGRDIASAAPGTEPVADGSGAISADWIVYGLHRPGGNSGYRTVMLYDRRTGQNRVLDQPAAGGDEFIGSPVLFDGKVFWLEADFPQNRSTIKSYDLSTGGRQTRSVPGADGLVHYGTGVALIRHTGSSEALTNYVGMPLARPVLATVTTSDAAYFTFDGTTLRWWSTGLGEMANVLYSNRPGSAAVGRNQVAYDGVLANPTGVSSWPFVPADWSGPAPRILDLRTRAVVSPPRGMNVQAVFGGDALIGTGADQVNGGLSLVPLSQLPPAHC